QPPKAGTMDPLRIILREPLDNFLLRETIQILDNNNKVINGSFTVSGKETQLYFVPAQQWKTGRYRLRVADDLEDLAGNNLARLFDRDLHAAKAFPGTVTLEREFSVGR
ncbi:MAG: Ig-like domain-containing protein, partial [Chitinophagaceae bacterium]